MKSKLFCNEFVLKIIAIVTMTIDHVGMFLFNPAYFPPTDPLYQVGLVFRIIGRIACPLFCFMLLEGALHTRNWKKYLIRLLIICVPILLVQVIADFGFHQKINAGNIFIDLSLGLLMIVAFENKRKSIKLLGILPILYGILSFVCYAIEYESRGQITIYWFPYFIRCQYYFLSLFLLAAMYGVYKLLPLIYKWYGLDASLHQNTMRYRFYQNCLISATIIFFTCIGYIFKYYDMNYWNIDIQSYMILSIIPILFYNGRRGYNAKWFQIASYLYYPVHLIIITAIFLL